jgi:hypothetical protein
LKSMRALEILAAMPSPGVRSGLALHPSGVLRTEGLNRTDPGTWT